VRWPKAWCNRCLLQSSKYRLRRQFLHAPDTFASCLANRWAGDLSHIEATFEHGYKYIDLTAEFVRKFKGQK
jgi:hypothetical protein